MREPPSEINGFHREHVQLLAGSFAKFLERDLFAQANDLSRANDATQPNDAPQVADLSRDDGSELEYSKRLFEAPFVVLSHGTESDPIFNYGNQAAMALFELDWQMLTSLPSRKSAEPVNRDERERLLAQVTRHNFIDDYAGVRISSTGRRFYIPQAIVWNLVDQKNEYRGQAATFAQWEFL